MKMVGDEAGQDYEMNSTGWRFWVHKCTQFIFVGRDIYGCLQRLDFEQLV